VKNFSKEVSVGLFAAVALGLLYLGFYFLKGVDFFKKRAHYYAVYENVDQLAVSNPVLVNGFAVGRVSSIQILQHRENKVLVELDIDSKVKLGDSTKAILTSEILSGRYIILNIGPVVQPRKEGDTITAEVAKGMLDVLTQTAEPVADNLQTTLRKFNTVIDNLANNTRQLDTIFMRLKVTPGLINKTLNTANGNIESVAQEFRVVVGNLNGTLNDLRPTLGNFRTLSDSLKQLKVNQTLQKLQLTLDGVNQTLAKLKKGDNTASKLLTEDSLYVNLNKLLVNMDTLVKHFDDNPKHFLSPFGKNQKKIERDRKKKEAARKPAAQK
jgi:phospholipid/cholesterol/gamma-HCH transport system substrate-binding protein